jgi:hypothetical protein
MARPEAVPPEQKPAEERDREVVTQRVRVGLTGLAAVFLLTLLAASIFNMLGQDDPKGLKLSNGTVITNIAAPPEPPKEPLAELGVAPGAAPLKPTIIPVPANGPVIPPPSPAEIAQPASPPVANQATAMPSPQPTQAAPPQHLSPSQGQATH